MDDSKTTHDLAIVGPLPPPYGGVTVHIKRLLAHLDRAGVDYVVYNTSAETAASEPAASSERIQPVGQLGWRWFVRYVLRGPEPVVYVHSSRWDVWAATWWLARARGKSVIIALHTDSLRRLWPVRGWLARRMVLGAFRAAGKLIAVNVHIRDFIDDVAGLGDKTSVIPAFIEPAPGPDDDDAVDSAVRSFCESHHPVILANGAPIVYDDGRDLYGIDMTIELLDSLRTAWPRIGVVWYVLRFAGWSPSYLEEMTQQIKRRGLEPQWLFVEPTGEMYPVFRNVGLFVRPTCSDGDAVSIREALHFGVPVVASDAAPRPPGTIVFSTRNQDNFVAKVQTTLESLDDERAKLANLPSSSAVAEEVDLLRRAIQEARGR